MPGKIADTTTGRRIEHAVRQLDSLSILTCTAVRFFSHSLKPQSSALADIIESDPALTSKVLSLMHQQGLSFAAENFSLRQVLDKLPADLVRNAVLSMNVDFGLDEPKVLPRKELVLHALAVACCARELADMISPKMNSNLAYCAGLLHDIGKLALDQAMPKSFARITEDAKLQNSSAIVMEQQYLGTDHTILGKRVAHKWHLPSQILAAIWLHHSNTDLISQNMPEARIAHVVQLADLVARQCGIGQSGSYDSPDLADKVAESISITPQQLQQIRHKLSQEVKQKSRLSGLDLPNPQATYCDLLGATAAQLAEHNTKLLSENRQLQTAFSHHDFVIDFIRSIKSASEPIDLAKNFALRWQKFYQTGPVCLYLAPHSGSQAIEAVLIENQSLSKTMILNRPADLPAVPQAIQNSFAILDAGDSVDWLFEQLDIDFDLSCTKLVPLISNDKAIAVVVFEFRHPAPPAKLEEGFKTTTSIAGAIIDMAVSCSNQRHFAEKFAPLIAMPHTQRKVSDDYSLIALAEMAAGAAHELNNPLSVVSGRVQLLTESETDQEKKEILKQIEQNSTKISHIIDDLMIFASPPQPKPAQTNIKALLKEAMQLTAQKHGDLPDFRIDIADGAESVFADSAQIVSAIASVFSNALESYTDKPGPIKVTATAGESGDTVKLQITDLGCGMDSETLKKATQPFFSSQPAGRKRGMGLAHAQRFIQLNNGSLNITSEPGKGTTVTVSLPCRQ